MLVLLVLSIVSCVRVFVLSPIGLNFEVACDSGESVLLLLCFLGLGIGVAFVSLFCHCFAFGEVWMLFCSMYPLVSWRAYGNKLKTT
jgi:hypothetical protein